MVGKQECDNENVSIGEEIFSVSWNGRRSEVFEHIHAEERDGVDSWETIGPVGLLLINSIIKDQKRKTKGVLDFG